jgi:hypothetical protein
MLYEHEGFFPTFPPVARALDFKDENRFIKVWIVVIDDLNDLHDQVGVSPGAEIIFFDMTLMRRSRDHVTFHGPYQMSGSSVVGV